MTYDELRTAVQDFCEESFSDTDFAVMTRNAEQKIYLAAQPPVLRQSTSINTVADTATITLPAGVLSIYNVRITSDGDQSPLLMKDPSFLSEAYFDAVPGRPAFYALGGQFSLDSQQTVMKFGPTPDDVYTVVVEYKGYPTSIVDISAPDTSWLGQNFESVLFNAVMVEAARHMKQEQDIVAMYEKQLQDSLLLYKQQVDGHLQQDTNRAPQVRIPAS